MKEYVWIDCTTGELHLSPYGPEALIELRFLRKLYNHNYVTLDQVILLERSFLAFFRPEMVYRKGLEFSCLGEL